MKSAANTEIPTITGLLLANKNKLYSSSMMPPGPQNFSRVVDSMDPEGLLWFIDVLSSTDGDNDIFSQ
jgi:hypothetical protein